MKYKYRGELVNGKVVDVFDFDGDVAKCDHGDGNIHIDGFNTIFIPKDVFKKDILKVEEVIKTKTASKKQ